MNGENHRLLSEPRVSRETLDKLKIYQELLLKWNRTINLVSSLTLNSAWARHFLDSAQLLDYANECTESWLDLGSGAGFPGLVVGLLAEGRGMPLRLTLIESDIRKATFLRTVARECDLNVTVLSERIEDTKGVNSDVISARALAPVTQLLSFAYPRLNEGGVCLFPKGRNYKDEVSLARETWDFDLEEFASCISADSTILKIKDIRYDG